MKRTEQVVFANGCFWCAEAVFQQIEGVQTVISGYAGGSVKNPVYRETCVGNTGHAEGILITYQPEEASFDTLLEVFFATHDPTTLNQQGNNITKQYRSEIFFTSEEQKKEPEALRDHMEANNVFPNPIITKLS